MKQIALPSQQSLEKFSTTLDVEEISIIATELIKTKQVFAAVSSPLFHAGIVRLGDWGGASQNPQIRLKAIATLERLRAVLKKKGAFIEPLLQNALAKSLPSLQLLASGEDRYYVANALFLSDSEWLLSFASEQMIYEGAAEKARISLAKTVIRKAKGLDNALLSLATAAKSIQIDEFKTGDANCKRYKRVFAALRSAIQSTSVDVGADISTSLRTLLRNAFEKSGPPEDLKIARDFASEFSQFLDRLVQIRLSLVVESDLYGALNSCRRWFPLSSWSSSVPKMSSIKALAGTISEGIRLSAKQGVTDQKLFDALELTTGSKEKALLVTRAIADGNPGLPEAVQQWLRQGRVGPVGQSSQYGEQSAQLRADEYVATALIEASELERILEIGKSTNESKDDARYKVEPLWPTIRATLVAIKNLAGARGMTLLGISGERCEFSPYQHAIVSGVVDTRYVRIVRPGVERTSANGDRQLVVKAIVEPLQ